MQYEILHQGAFSLLQIKLQAGETIKAESGAMVSMTSNVELRGNVEGGLLKGIGRMLSGEKFFFQELSAKGREAEVTLAPISLGNVVAVELDGRTPLYVQKDGFLAATKDIEIGTKMQNLSKGILSGEGFFIIEIRGRGTVFLSSFGAIETKYVEAGEELIIDNGHLVAWPGNMHYNIERASRGWISTFTTGEVAVCRFRGPGAIFIQTRNARAIAAMLGQFIPKS